MCMCILNLRIEDINQASTHKCDWHIKDSIKQKIVPARDSFQFLKLRPLFLRAVYVCIEIAYIHVHRCN